MRPLSSWFISLALLLPGLASCELEAVVEKRYETGSEARNAEAFEGGLLPSWLPNKAQDVLLYADLDINDVWVRFELEPSEVTKLASKLERLGREELKGTGLGAPYELDWWDDCLFLGYVDRCGPEIEFYSGDGFSLALDRKRGIGYVWKR